MSNWIVAVDVLCKGKKETASAQMKREASETSGTERLQQQSLPSQGGKQLEQYQTKAPQYVQSSGKLGSSPREEFKLTPLKASKVHKERPRLKKESTYVSHAGTMDKPHFSTEVISDSPRVEQKRRTTAKQRRRARLANEQAAKVKSEGEGGRQLEAGYQQRTAQIPSFSTKKDRQAVFSQRQRAAAKASKRKVSSWADAKNVLQELERKTEERREKWSPEKEAGEKRAALESVTPEQKIRGQLVRGDVPRELKAVVKRLARHKNWSIAESEQVLKTSYRALKRKLFGEPSSKKKSSVDKKPVKYYRM